MSKAIDSKSKTTPLRLFDYSLHYSNWHDDSDQHALAQARGLRGKLVPILPPAPHAAVLDIGCGMGFALLGLKDAGFSDISGIDMDPQQVAACRRRGLKVECVSDSTAFLRERENVGRYDAVLLFDVLEHIPVADQISFMRTVREALRPGGVVVVQTPNALSILAPFWRYIDYTHQCIFSEYSLRFVLLNAGFRRVELEASQPLPWRPPLRLWNAHARSEAKKWLIKWLWREAVAIEYPSDPNPNGRSYEPNLFCVAYSD